MQLRPKIKSILFYSLFAAILALPASSRAGTIIWRNGETQLQDAGNASVVGTGNFLATGKAAEIIAGGMAGSRGGGRSRSAPRRQAPAVAAPRKPAPRSPKPAAPRPSAIKALPVEPASRASGGERGAAPAKAPVAARILPISDSGSIIAGMYEFLPGAFFFSRHTLQSNPEFAAVLKDYFVFEFRSQQPGGAPLDVLLGVRASSKSQATLDRLFERLENSQGEKTWLQLRHQDLFLAELSGGEAFESRLISTVGSSPVEGVVHGAVARVELTLKPEEAPFVHAFLDIDTGPGSSGALIYVEDGSRQRKLAGLVECHVSPVALDKKEHQTLEGTRLITMRALEKSPAYAVDPQHVALEPVRFRPDICTPIDNRAGGGF